METTDVSWREICGNEEELSLLFHHIEPDGVGAVGQATVVDGDLFAPPDCPAGVDADLAAGNVADVIRIRVVGVVVERPVAQRHGCRLLVPPPGEVVVKEARPIEEPLPVRLIHRDHRADLDQLTGRDIPAGKYSPAPLLRRTNVYDIRRVYGPVHPRTFLFSTFCHGITGVPHLPRGTHPCEPPRSGAPELCGGVIGGVLPGEPQKRMNYSGWLYLLKKNAGSNTDRPNRDPVFLQKSGI